MIEKSGSSLAPYFCNRMGEIRANLDLVRESCPVDPLMHVSEDLNPSDLPTRGLARIQDIQCDSVWIVGPSFLNKTESVGQSQEIL